VSDSEAWKYALSWIFGLGERLLIADHEHLRHQIDQGVSENDVPLEHVSETLLVT